jgi:hypothetical protein
MRFRRQERITTGSLKRFQEPVGLESGRPYPIDILEHQEEGNRLCPVEIKSGSTAAGDTIEGLKWWCGLAGNAAGSQTLV